VLSNLLRVAFVAFVLQLLVLSPSYAATGPGGMPIPGSDDEEYQAIQEELAREAAEEEEVEVEIPPIEMIFIEGGCYDMGDFAEKGDPDEKPVHEVCVSDFRLAEVEVTQELWEAVMGFNPMIERDVDMQKPVARITWFWATRFIEVLNDRTGGFYRLPTEAEWEFAARERGEEVVWSGTSDENHLREYSSFMDTSDMSLQTVKSYKPNALGLYDMSGSVWEWMDDNFGFEYYKESPKDDPYGPDYSNWKTIRGGSYVDTPHRMRTTYRHAFEPVLTSYGLGLRLAE